MRPRYGQVYRWPWSIAAEVCALEGAAPVLQADVARLRMRAASELDDRQRRSMHTSPRSIVISQRAERRMRRPARSPARPWAAANIVEVHRNRQEIRQLRIERDFLRRLHAPAVQLAAITNWRANAIALHLQCDSLRRDVERLKQRWPWQVRTGTFQPYFLGQTSLLRDVVRKGAGIVVTEEAPGFYSGKHSRGASHGLENLLDVILKFFGL